MKLSTLMFSVIFLGALQFMGPAALRPFPWGRGAAPRCRAVRARAARNPCRGTRRDSREPAAAEARRLRAVREAVRAAETALRGIEGEERRLREALGSARSAGPLAALAEAGPPSPARDGEAALLARLEALERQRLALESLREGLDLEAALLEGGKGTRPGGAHGARAVLY